MGHIVDLIRMQMKPGTSERAVLDASERAQELFRRMPGLLRRTLLGPDARGWWTDLSEFADLRSLEEARLIAHGQPGDAADYFALVDMKSMAFERLEVRTQLEQTLPSRA